MYMKSVNNLRQIDRSVVLPPPPPPLFCVFFENSNLLMYIQTRNELTHIVMATISS